MPFQIHHLSCFDAQVVNLDEAGKGYVKEALSKMRNGEAHRDTVEDKNTIDSILAGTGITRAKAGDKIFEFNLTGHWRIFAYKTGAWTRTTPVTDKYGNAVPNVPPAKFEFDGTWWPVKIGHLENNRCMMPSSRQLG